MARSAGGVRVWLLSRVEDGGPCWRRGLLQPSLEQGLRVPGHGCGDAIGGVGHVEVVCDPAVQVRSPLSEQGELLPQRGQGAVESPVREVRRGGVVGGVTDGPSDVTPDEGNDVQLATFRRGRHRVLPVGVAGRQISKMEWPV
ncbi:hypothetical protein GCM10023153_00320 [Ornithinibacter aureus]|uniref:Uncharacterized protein n=1 Tax=Ornithinibacter aureus TaxID=622664 RepID=A0ABP8J7W5_9MICO